MTARTSVSAADQSSNKAQASWRFSPLHGSRGTRVTLRRRSRSCRGRSRALRPRSAGTAGRPATFTLQQDCRGRARRQWFATGRHPRYFSGKATTSQSARESSHDETHDTGTGCASHGGAGQGHPGCRRKLRHHQEALRFYQGREHRRHPPRLPRDDVPLHRGDEDPHLRRHPLRRDHPPEGQGRHAAAQAHRGRRLPAGHQGRRRHQAASLLARRGDHRRPRRPARPHQGLRRARRQIRQVAGRHRHRPQHALLQLHQRQRSGTGALCGAVRGGRTGADRGARGAHGRRPRYRHVREDHRVGAEGDLRPALLRQGPRSSRPSSSPTW